MSDDLVLEHLRHIRAVVDDTREDIAEIRSRLGLLEGGYAAVSHRLDRMGGDIARIKRRLDLVESE